MKPKEQNKSNNGRNFVFGLLFVLVVVAIAEATTISDVLSSFSQVTAISINGGLWTQAGNYSDIQARIDACPISGCKVHISGGIPYQMTSSLLLKDNLELICEDFAGYLNVTNASARITTTTNISHVSIKNCYIESNNLSNLAIYLAGTNIYVTDVEIAGNYIHNSTQRVVHLNGTRLNVHDNRLIDVYSGIGVAATNADGTTRIINNEISAGPFNSSSLTEYGEGIDGNQHQSGECIIADNIITGFREDGIDASCLRSIVSNNHVNMVSDETRRSTGITIAAQGRPGELQAIGNTITNISVNGYGIYVVAANSTIISDNIITGMSYPNSTGVWIRQDVQNAIVNGNQIREVGLGIHQNNTATTITNNMYRGVTTLRNITGTQFDIREMGNFSVPEIYVGTSLVKVCRLDGTNCPTGVLGNNGWSNTSYNVSLSDPTINMSAGILLVDNTNQKVQISTASANGSYLKLLRGTGGFNFTLDGANNSMTSNAKKFFIGTSDAQAFAIKTNNTERVTVDVNGGVNFTGTLSKIYLPNLAGTGTIICFNTTDNSIYRNITPGCA